MTVAKAATREGRGDSLSQGSLCCGISVRFGTE